MDVSTACKTSPLPGSFQSPAVLGPDHRQVVNLDTELETTGREPAGVVFPPAAFQSLICNPFQAPTVSILEQSR